MKTITLALALATTSAFAQDSRDLSIPGAKWWAKHTGYTCSETVTTTQPAELAALNVAFERIVTDSSLDNGVITASFTEEGRACRYSAIVFADNAASTMRLVDSKAYAVADSSECAAGKAVLDAAFESNDYLYYGRPHHLGVMMPMASAASLCGEGATHVGVVFVVGGKL